MLKYSEALGCNLKDWNALAKLPDMCQQNPLNKWCEMQEMTQMALPEDAANQEASTAPPVYKKKAAGMFAILL